MNTSPFESTPGTNLAQRFLWLFVLPTGSSTASWVALFVLDGGGTGRLVVTGCIPLLGVLAVGAYKTFTRDHVRLGLYLPFVLAAVVYVASMVDLAISIAREPDGAFIPVLPLGVGFLLPFIALVCGMAGFVVNVPPRR